MIDFTNQLQKAKTASLMLGAVTEEQRVQVLASLSEALASNMQKIIKENAKDLERLPQEDPKYDRLLLNRDRIQGIACDVFKVANLPSPLGRVWDEKNRPNGLHIQKISVPLGVVGVIYESRPNVTIDVFSLCFKSGNICLLKGGKEAHHTNVFLVQIIKETLSKHHLNPDYVTLMPPMREATLALLEAKGLVDICIPRGSRSLIDFVRDRAKIPVIETGAGIVHMYFDKSGDAKKGRLVINNAKTRRVSVCNALDTLLVHEERLSDLNFLLEPLKNNSVKVFADPLSFQELKKGIQRRYFIKPLMKTLEKNFYPAQ